jgi:hypothetical protein
MTWQHIISRWNCIIPYRDDMNSCWMHIMRDKHVSRVWCGNIDTYRYNTYRVFRAVKWHDIILSQLDHTVSCRNDLVRDAYQTGQIRIECLVRKHKYISLEYISSVLCRQMTWQHIVSWWNFIIPYRVETNSCGMITCGTNKHRVFSAETEIHFITIHIECFVRTYDMTVYRLVSKSRWNCIIPYRVETNSCGIQTRIESLVWKHKYISFQYISGCISCGTNKQKNV